MRVLILDEAFFEASLFGTGLSKGITSDMEYEDFIPQVVGQKAFYIAPDAPIITDHVEPTEQFIRMDGVVEKLAPLDHGHNKCLYQIVMAIDCQMPRYWWQEADQYKVGTVTQSESTMFTIHKKPFTQDMFQDGDVPDCILSLLNELREEFLATKDKEIWRKIIKCKPESFLQRRILTTNYKNMREVFIQRKGHRLLEWEYYINSIKEQCQHPELLP